MSLVADLRILWHLAVAPIEGSSHAERMESFYRGQSRGYDDFRRRLLHGRRELIEALPMTPQSVWVDLGGGTGANLEFAGDRLPDCREVYVVDLAPSLLQMAQRRVADHGWENVRIVQADATAITLPERVDLVTFSYSLTMIPDWFDAIDRAWDMLRPGGTIGVVDFFVSRKYAPPGRSQHGWFTRNLLPLWFSSDGVFLGPDRLAYLQRRFATCELRECLGSIPWLPFVSVPYVLFVGRKSTDSR